MSNQFPLAYGYGYPWGEPEPTSKVPVVLTPEECFPEEQRNHGEWTDAKREELTARAERRKMEKAAYTVDRSRTKMDRAYMEWRRRVSDVSEEKSASWVHGPYALKRWLRSARHSRDKAERRLWDAVKDAEVVDE